jgi:hypothetical protein
MNIDFGQWLAAEIEKRGWKQADLEREAGGDISGPQRVMPALGGAILNVPPLMLRDILRTMYDRIDVLGRTLTLVPKEWCAEWAGCVRTMP